MEHQEKKTVLITKSEAARRLGVCRQTFYNMLERGVLRVVKITATKERVRAADIEALGAQ